MLYSLSQSVFHETEMGGQVRETVLQSANLWSCWNVNKQNTETWPVPGRLLYSKSVLPVDTSKQKRSFPMASIKHLITVQLTHSFVCLLNVFARPLLSKPFPHLAIHSLFPAMSQIFSIKAVTTSRFTWFDWTGHAQSILEEVCEKLSDITLALTKRCECPDRGNDMGHIRLNDSQRSSSPFIPAWHWITWVSGQVCICICEVYVCVCACVCDIKGQSEWKSEKDREKRGWRRCDRGQKKQKDQ